MPHQRPTQGMNVIGHDDEGHHLTTLVFEVVQGGIDKIAMAGIPKQAFTVTFIQQGFELTQVTSLKLFPSQMLFNGQTSLILDCGLQQPAFPHCQLVAHFLQDVRRNGVIETKGGEVTGAGHPPVRQTTLIAVELSLRRTAAWIESLEVLWQRDLLGNSPSHPRI